MFKTLLSTKTTLLKSINQIANASTSSSGLLKVFFNGKVSRHGDLHIHGRDIKEILNKPEHTDFHDTILDEALNNSVAKHRDAGGASVWLHVPLELSSIIKIANKYEFKYHHAEDDQAVLFKWLLDRKSTVPRYATHQLGVGGIVYNEEKDEVLVVKDKHSVRKVWKLPGGAADLGESIDQTAEREVLEETGIKSQFRSVIAYRQQHDYPGAYGRSDFYFACRLKPLTTEIKHCKQEIAACEWMRLDELVKYTDNPMLNRVCKLLNYAKKNSNNFSLIDMSKTEMKSILVNRNFSLFHRPLPENEL